MNYLFDEIFKEIIRLEGHREGLPSSIWMKMMQQQETSYPLKVEISLTKECNQCCMHCSNGGSAQSVFLKLSCIDEILQMQPGYVVLTGGEPLLYPALKDVIKKIKATNAFLKICTNGSLLERMINVDGLDELLERSDVIQISFDAVDELTYELIRGKRHFAKVLENVKTLKAKYAWIKVELHCVPSISNIDQLIDIYKLACVLNVDFFSVAPLAPLGNAAYIDSVDVERLLYIHRELLKRSLAEKTKYIGRPYEMASLYGKIRNDSKEFERSYSCGAGYKTLYFRSDGEVFPCVYMQRDSLCLGNINHGYQNVLHNIERILPRSYSLEKSPCSNCYLWGVCSGGCLGLSFEEKGSCVPGYDPRCAYYL